jgi:hypothetical protein
MGEVYHYGHGIFLRIKPANDEADPPACFADKHTIESFSSAAVVLEARLLVIVPNADRAEARLVFKAATWVSVAVPAADTAANCVCNVETALWRAAIWSAAVKLLAGARDAATLLVPPGLTTRQKTGVGGVYTNTGGMAGTVCTALNGPATAGPHSKLTVAGVVPVP